MDQARGGLPVYMVTKDADVDALTKHMAPGLTHEVQIVEYSWDDLVAQQEAVEAQRAVLEQQGVPIVSTGIRTSTNSVVVKFETDAVINASTVSSRVGFDVQGGIARNVVADACPKSNCHPPAKAGVGILSTQAGTGNNDCTAGFVMRVSSHPVETGEPFYAALTAGHCFRLVNSGLGVKWRHEIGDDATRFGRALENTWFNGSDADVGLLRFYIVPSDRNNMVVNTSGTLRSITEIATPGEMNEGDMVCRIGRNSVPPATCGNVTDLSENMPSPLYDGGPSRSLEKQILVNFDSVSGDSGGPVYSPISGSFAEAYGTHVHSEDPADNLGWFSAVTYAINQMSSTHGITMSLCVTNAC